MPTPIPRMALGFLAAVLAVLTFHQITVWVLGVLGLIQASPYSWAPVPPWGVPRIVNLCFWGGLYGAVFGLLWPTFAKPAWLSGLVMGIIAALMGMFVVSAIKGLPAAFGWSIGSMLRSFVINGMWGVGLGLFSSVLLPPQEPKGYRTPVRR